MEFGSNWLQPINQRLGNKYKFLSTSELDDYNRNCQTAMSEGHNYVYHQLEKLADLRRSISDNDLRRTFNDHMRDNCSWINDSNLRRLYNQSRYYAWKDGLSNVIK